MGILDRIIFLLGNNDQKDLTNSLGIGKQAFSDWKSGRSNSYLKYLVEIASFFDVSLDYLVYGKNSKEDFLRPDEQELLTYYNSVDDNAKALIRERASTLAELVTNDEKTITIKVAARAKDNSTYETEQISKVQADKLKSAKHVNDQYD